MKRICETHTNAKTPKLCAVCLIKERNTLQAENARLKELLGRAKKECSPMQESDRMNDITKRIKRLHDDIEQALKD